LPFAIGSAFAFVLKVLGAEIEQQTNLNAARREVIHQLRASLSLFMALAHGASELGFGGMDVG
jgi:hypothetical protein